MNHNNNLNTRWSQPSCGTQNRRALLLVADDFDHCANSHSLHRPQGAVVFLALSLRREVCFALLLLKDNRKRTTHHHAYGAVPLPMPTAQG